MKVLTAPECYEPGYKDVKCFLAGGITGCPDWQKSVIGYLKEQSDLDNLVIFNPRRDVFENSEDAAHEQISWEFDYLNSCDIFSMYFCADQIQPICLYELGRYVEVMKRRFPADYQKRIIISCSPYYPRHFDVVSQVSMAFQIELLGDRPEIPNLMLYTSSERTHSMEICKAYKYVKSVNDLIYSM